ncbi:hypothetical protein AYO20_02351 [Fonsecaea nubica]|uniref:Cyclase n=1 Tax=Fonsecaea nubica TaxID=856822 RepID=A0A178D9K9_9EURO|nr:hypothetical protein AYO20_02351 [Fonsecaea nubica]OAL38292.1 hypothetical protein AYO20_02351 [Fonsecaea nubica]
MADFDNIPDFDSLPEVKGMPKGCAWGVFDKDGTTDYLGCFNLLTPAVKKEACKEARDGVSISLNWPLNAIGKPGYGRRPTEHTVLDAKLTLDIHSFDDEVAFNTQASSQWDSLVHYGHQHTGLCYNGSRPTTENLIQGFRHCDKSLPTLNHWHEKGCLVGRGVLLDYRAYAQAKGIQYSCFDNVPISVQDLEAVAAHQGTKFKYGDILLVRTGFTEDLDAADIDEQTKLLGTHKTVGVKGSLETARWLWNHHFSAVAGDAIAFESLPPQIEEEGGKPGGYDQLVLHKYLLAFFGMPIGELWDLKALGEYCAKAKRYEFLLTSAPLNYPGSVGSPPNAIAVF